MNIGCFINKKINGTSTPLSHILHHYPTYHTTIPPTTPSSHPPHHHPTHHTIIPFTTLSSHLPYHHLIYHNIISNHQTASSNLAEVTSSSDLLILVFPHQFVNSVCEEMRGHIRSGAKAVSLIKVGA